MTSYYNKKLVKDYLSLLEINKRFSINELKGAYKEQLKVWHPDRFNSDIELQKKANDRTAKINEAYDYLINNLEAAQNIFDDIPEKDWEKQYDKKSTSNKKQKKETNPNRTKTRKARSQKNKNTSEKQDSFWGIWIILLTTFTLFTLVIWNAPTEEEIKERKRIQDIEFKKKKDEYDRKEKERIKREAENRKKEEQEELIRKNDAKKLGKKIFLQYFKNINEMNKYTILDYEGYGSSKKYELDFSNQYKNYFYKYLIQDTIISWKTLKSSPAIIVESINLFRNSYKIYFEIEFQRKYSEQRILDFEYANHHSYNGEYKPTFPIMFEISDENLYENYCKKCDGEIWGYDPYKNQALWATDFIDDKDRWNKFITNSCKFRFSIEVPYNHTNFTFYGVGKKNNNITYTLTSHLNKSINIFYEKLPYKTDDQWKKYAPQRKSK